MGLPVFRSAGDPADPAVLLVHGYPASSHMWRPVAGRARRARAVRDRARPARLRRLRARAARDQHLDGPRRGARGAARRRGPRPRGARRPRLGRADRPALGVRPPGRGLGDRGHRTPASSPTAAGTAWPTRCARPSRGSSSSTAMTLEGFTAMLGSISSGIGPDDAREYFKAFADEPRRRGQLELYRSGEFSELEAYDGRLAALGVPFLALWGEDDPFAPVAGAQRFAREVAGRPRAGDPGHRALRLRGRAGDGRAGARRVPRRGGAALMHVRELGEGPPVLLLHPGPGLDGTVFLPGVERLAESHRVLLADLPGNGHSPDGDRNEWTLAGFAARRRAARAASSSWRTGRCSATPSAGSSRCSTSSTSRTAPRGSSPPAPTRARRRRPARRRTRSRG